MERDVGPMKILVTGASGLLGTKIVNFTNTSEIYGTYYQNPVYFDYGKTFRLDVSKRNATNLIRKTAPDVVVHTAAYTNVDRCELDRKNAYQINVEGTSNVALGARNSKLVYISTDYIFDGEAGMYHENDEPNPVSYYGQTKLEGEQIVQEICDNYIIARTSVLYGWHTRLNFVSWVIHELQKRNKINIVTDQVNSPTLADDLAEQIMILIKRDEQGIFHTAGGERISRYEFAREIARIFELDETLITPVTSEQLKWIAKRPKDSSLDVEKISKIKKPMNIAQSLEWMKRQK